MSTVIKRRVLSAIPELPTIPLLQRIYAARQVTSVRELEKGFDRLLPFATLTGIDAAAELLHTALAEGWRILIVGDYDADGATSCALAVRVLRALGAADVRYFVPDRFKYGYGLTPAIVEVAASEQPDLLITVDNGVSSLDGVEAAKARGIRVLITDHHLPGAELPAADAMVNPNQPGDAFPSKNLAGVGVIFYVMLALRARLRATGWFDRHGLPVPNMARWLDLVALGTVADVVPLDHNNRILVEQGLRRIRVGQCVAGIQALAQVSGCELSRLQTDDFGFRLGPRINAAGRLEDMRLGIECLLCDEPTQALRIAQELDRLNRERRDIQTEMQAQAQDNLARLNLTASELPFGLCLFDESWHQGVVGIVAARVRDQTYRPTIAFAPDQDGHIKGSARSRPGLHIRDCLDAVATRHPGLLTKFGGHAAAAGLSLPLAHFADFSAAFDQEVRRHLNPADLCDRLLSDGELTADELSLPVAELLQDAGPWGQGFPAPLFDGVFEVVSRSVVKDKHLKMLLRPPGATTAVEAMAFYKADAFALAETQVRVAYRLEVDEWRGRRRVSLKVAHIETP